MDTNTWERIEALFFEALERPEGERAAFLAGACAGRPELRAEIEAMLAVHDDDTGMKVERVLLDTTGREAQAGGLDPRPAVPDRAGQRIGPWRLERPLGHGGMGEVWLAARAAGEYDQRAAVKLVRPGWRAAQLVPRFRHERQLLARLEHPNIARLLDGGLTEDGFPYLAMEFVDGRTVTEWCEARGASTRDRLVLFRTICEAVRFAHTNLVVHRDLKPQNILVTADGRPVLLDFGIAKLLDPDDGAPPPTRDEDRVLTPEHAAPEQLRGEVATTATDVWALGVLLYELLTGARPFTGLDCTPTELERRVLLVEPPPPSTAAGSRERAHALRGDLDRIVMKALQKEPARRYRSAEDLGEDVDRWLSGLPVRATPDSFGYRARKFVRRNRAALAIAGFVGMLVLAFGVVAAWQARRIAKERDLAVSAREDSDAAVSMLVDIFRTGDPRAVQGGDSLRIGDLLQQAEAKLTTSTESPRVRTKLWRTLAEVHGIRSRFEAQRSALDHALAAARESGQERDVAAVLHEQARYVMGSEGFAAAEPLLRESLARHEALYGPDADEVAVVAQDLASVVTEADEQARLLERVLTVQRRNFARATQSDSSSLASALNGLGSVQFYHRRMAAAEAAFAESRRLIEAIHPEDHPDVVSVRSNEAVSLQVLGRFPEAEALLREVLASRRRVFGNETAWVASSLGNLGVCLANEGKYAEAIAVLREALETAEKTLGPEHRDTGGYRSDLAISLVRGGSADEGFQQYDRCAPDSGDADGVGWVDFNLGRMRLELAVGRPVPLDSLRAMAARLRTTDPPRPALFLKSLQTLGTGLLTAPRGTDPGEAERVFTEVLSLTAGEEPPFDRALARCGLEVAHARTGHAVDRKALKEALDVYGPWGLADPGLVRSARAVLETGAVRRP